MKLRFLRATTPYVVRFLTTYWRNKIVDLLPIPALKEMRRCVYIMYNTSKKILAERKADLEKEMRAGVEPEADESKIKGKDIMSILRTLSCLRLSFRLLSCRFAQ